MYLSKLKKIENNEKQVKFESNQIENLKFKQKMK